jgi:hypothetical protein
VKSAESEELHVHPHVKSTPFLNSTKTMSNKRPIISGRLPGHVLGARGLGLGVPFRAIFKVEVSGGLRGKGKSASRSPTLAIHSGSPHTHPGRLPLTHVSRDV